MKNEDTIWSFLGVIFSLLGTIGLVFVGILGSIYTSEIKNSFPFRLFRTVIDTELEVNSPLLFSEKSYPMHQEALFFYLLFLAFIILFIWGYKISQKLDNQIKRETMRTVELTNKKIAEGQILPSREFLGDVHINTKNVFEILNEYYLKRSKLKKSELEGMVSRGLHSILALLSAYEADLYGEIEGVAYGANVMTFSSDYKKNKSMCSQIKKDLLFIDGSTDLDSLEGVLVFQPKLSASSLHPDRKWDPLLQKLTLSLPVPSQSFINEKYVALPGAPLAYLEPESVNRYEDTLRLHEWMDKEGDFLQSVKSQVRDYFSSEKAQSVRSFLSLPLVYKEQCIAVLNIHKNQTKLLYRDEQLDFFTRLLLPYCEALAELVGAWKQAEKT